MLPHSAEPYAVAAAFGADLEHGLTDARVLELLAQYGPNKLEEKKKKTMLTRILEQFKDAMIIILLAAAAISFIIAFIEGNTKEFFEPILILAIVVINAVLGLLQESKAEKALEALQQLSVPKAKVLRDGEKKLIDSSGLVPGDVMLLEAGDFVPADGRIFRAASLKSEEAVLTGESVPSDKFVEAIPGEEKVSLGDRENMVFSGCSITYGTGAAVVTGTGMKTEMGKIAGLLAGAGDSQTPLQQKLAKLGKTLGIVALAACLVIFIVGLLDGLEPVHMFMTAVALAVSAIPEGLPAIVTIVLSIGVQRMVKRNAIIRRLPAVETLGSASVICSDKTGTLTQNRMTLVSAWRDGMTHPEVISSQNSEQVRELLRNGTLCSDGSVVFGEDGSEQHLGDPTETSIIVAAHKNGMEQSALNESYPRAAELPFDSERKLMTSVNRVNDRLLVIVKGALDSVEKICTSGDLERARSINEELSNNALRVLSLAFKIIDELPAEVSSAGLESGLTFMGLVGMMDPPREEAAEAVRLCRSAGIKPVMITGDHVVTATAIAKALGIMQKGDEAITGVQLAAMTEEELDSRIRHIAVYARVSPEDKIAIIRAWQRSGEVVSMTGDGVNDAPALKAADIGCAMGITGTDVAKGAADIILTDDNFATIVEAVREGRGIYANIRKVVGFLLGTNVGEVLAVFSAMIIWKVSPLLSMQLLWINLVTDGLPAVALGMEAVEPDVMEKLPKPKGEGIFAHGLGLRIMFQGALFAALTLIAYRTGLMAGGSEAAGQTLAFMVLALSQIVQAFNMRSDRSLFKIGPFTNKKLNLAALGSLALMAAVLFTPLTTPFGLEYLTRDLYLAGLGLAIAPLLVMEGSKAFGLVRHRK